MAMKKALIVEDNPLNMELLEELLTLHGFAVGKAENAAEAEEQLRESRPDVIFLDIQLPGEDGISLAQRLKAEYGPDLPTLIAVTAHAMRGDAEKILEAGFEHYLAKPINFSEFNHLIEDLQLDAK